MNYLSCDTQWALRYGKRTFCTTDLRRFGWPVRAKPVCWFFLVFECFGVLQRWFVDVCAVTLFGAFFWHVVHMCLVSRVM